MRFKRIISLMLGIMAMSVMMLWPVASTAKLTHFGRQTAVIMGDEDDDILPPPPPNVPSPDAIL